ncbi:uncharacterized protein BO80DRAFT_504390 [Aspergillus ibericus CBS 121593]|uniref:Uncharacterized protein n=1 Tax=Aspergillus ibericus CBS 121593 TaxID=1448316 RepID=A0A395GUZ5_9EURO|nr:hypothetical protein BO80DRAFT_504390 [Aspergillus ibericus CBS 121593]RAK97933.1 hypothetical protein BO80DRAFT_504390 [Aspergillus ibericus CBS 121593]
MSPSTNTRETQHVPQLTLQHNQKQASHGETENQTLHPYLQHLVHEFEGLAIRNRQLEMELSEARDNDTRLGDEDTQLNEEYYQELRHKTRKLHFLEGQCITLYRMNRKLEGQLAKMIEAHLARKAKEDEITGLKDKISTLESERTGLHNKVASLQGKVDGLNDKIASLESENNGLRTKVAGLQGNIDTLQNRVADGKVEITDLKYDLEDAEDRASRLEKDKKRLENTVYYLRDLLSRKKCKFF